MEQEDIERIVENCLNNLQLKYDYQDNSVNLWYNGYLVTFIVLPDTD